MKMFVICDNNDTLVGMKLAGVDGVVVHEDTEVIEEIKKTAARNDVAVILITSLLKSKCADFIANFMNKHSEPLFLEIPDRHSAGRDSGSISDFIEKSIGLKLGEQ